MTMKKLVSLDNTSQYTLFNTMKITNKYTNLSRFSLQINVNCVIIKYKMKGAI